MIKVFIKKCVLIVIPVLFILGIRLFLPANEAMKRNMLLSHVDKNILLSTTPSPRIIFIGGSNLAFGLNSKIIKDSLHVNPINSAINFDIGLKFMLRNSLHHLKENDIVVISPEYQEFYDDLANGEIELLWLVLNVPGLLKDLDFRQYLKLINYISEYKPQKLRNVLNLIRADKSIQNDKLSKIGIYDRWAFNSFGDVCSHWKLPKENVAPYESMGKILNEDMFAYLASYQEKLNKRNIKLFITYPCCQELSYRKCFLQINKIESKLKAYGFKRLGTPERYTMNDSLIFDFPYHLIKTGVDYRTRLLVEDLKKEIQKLK